MGSPKYRFTPSLLAKWTDFVDSEALYQEFYGNSDEPSVSLEEFEAKQEKELWDAINRVPQEPSEAASRGTLLNVIVDCKVQWERPDAKYKIRRISDERGRMTAIAGECDEFSFEYDADLCRMLFDYFKGCICQYRCEATIDTAFGDVILYGDADYIRRDKVFDLKTTKSYKYGKFEKGWQKDLYPYCLIESGDTKNIKGFEFTVVKWAGGTKTQPLISGEMFREYYTYDHCESAALLRQECERFIEWLEVNRDKITNKKIFGLSDE